LSDEAWLIVKKDKVWELKAQNTRKQMTMMKDFSNVWLKLVGSLDDNILDDLSIESKKLMNVMTAGLVMQNYLLNTDLRNHRLESINQPKISTDSTPIADEDDSDLYARDRQSRTITNAIVVGMAGANQQKPRHHYPSIRSRCGHLDSKFPFRNPLLLLPNLILETSGKKPPAVVTEGGAVAKGDEASSSLRSHYQSAATVGRVATDA
jgi:hypothetical protein